MILSEIDKVETCSMKECYTFEEIKIIGAIKDHRGYSRELTYVPIKLPRHTILKKLSIFKFFSKNRCKKFDYKGCNT